jgi:hypothetical protein
MAGLTLDAGALIAFERKDRDTVLFLWRSVAARLPIAIPAGVLAQVWRDGRRQAQLAKFLVAPEVSIEPLSERAARLVGALCGYTKTSDVVDASVVYGARLRGDRVMTSDPDDLRRIDPKIELIVV